MFTWEKRDPNAPTPRADFVVCWMRDLVDIKAKQTTECLRNKKGMCCLGVAANRASIPWFWDASSNRYVIKNNGRDLYDYLPTNISQFLKIDSTGIFTKSIYVKRQAFLSLVDMNDMGMSFRTIAKTIQKECENLFKDLSTEEIAYIKGYAIPTRKQLRDEAKKNKG